MVVAVFSSTVTVISTEEPALAPWAVRAWAVTWAPPCRMPLKTQLSLPVFTLCRARAVTLPLSLTRLTVVPSSAAVP